MNQRLDALAPPPRGVPVTIQLKVLLGGFLQQFGWAFFAFGMIFVLIFVTGGGLFEGAAKSLAFRGDIVSSSGKVLWARETNASQNDTEIVFYGYEYGAGDQIFRGECYFTGWQFDEGDQVQVEYLADRPELSRIQGGRWSQFSPWVGLVVLLFPSVGLLLAMIALPGGVRSLKLLKTGRVAYGTLQAKEATGASINEQSVYEYTFKFTAESTGREHLVTSKTHHTNILEDEEHEPLLYLPSRPEEAVMFDNIPGSPEVDDRGRILGCNPLVALAYLILPVTGLLMLAVVVNDALSTQV